MRNNAERGSEKMEKWLKEAKRMAKVLANQIVLMISEEADSIAVDSEWFREEVMKHINKQKEG